MIYKSSNRTPDTFLIRHLTLLSLSPFSNDLHLFLFPLPRPDSYFNRPSFVTLPTPRPSHAAAIIGLWGHDE